MPKIHRHTVRERVLAYLYTLEGQARHWQRIAEGLEHPNERYVGVVCEQLAQAGQLEPCGAGYYRRPRPGERAHGA